VTWRTCRGLQRCEVARRLPCFANPRCSRAFARSCDTCLIDPGLLLHGGLRCDVMCGVCVCVCVVCVCVIVCVQFCLVSEENRRRGTPQRLYDLLERPVLKSCSRIFIGCLSSSAAKPSVSFLWTRVNMSTSFAFLLVLFMILRSCRVLLPAFLLLYK